MTIRDMTKIWHSRYGHADVFSDDITDRVQLDEPGALALFQQVWDQAMKDAFMKGKPISAEDAFQQIEPADREYLKERYTHWAFTCNGVEYIAQIYVNPGLGAEVNQLWECKRYRRDGEEPDELDMLFMDPDQVTLGHSGMGEVATARSFLSP